MKKFKQFLLATVFVLGGAGLASAADISSEHDAAPAEPSYSQAPAKTGFYVRGDLGWDWLQDRGSKANAFVFGGGVGYRFNDMFRADVRFDYGFNYKVIDTTVNPAVTDKFDIGSVLANGYIDIPVGTIITPYVGVGLGYGWASQHHGPSEDSFTGALMAGASVDVTDNVAIDVGYRLRRFFRSGGTNDHAVEAGVRFSF